MIPLPFIIGDNQGGDNICGQRTCHYGITGKSISWCCDATSDNCSGVSKDSCSFIHIDYIIQWCSRKAKMYMVLFQTLTNQVCSVRQVMTYNLYIVLLILIVTH
jgi:hypothetical protein